MIKAGTYEFSFPGGTATVHVPSDVHDAELEKSIGAFVKECACKKPISETKPDKDAA